MFNLPEYSKNYRKTTGNLWNYYRDEPSNLSSDSESFKYKTSIQRNTYIILMLVKLIMMKIKLVKMKLKLLFH